MANVDVSMSIGVTLIGHFINTFLYGLVMYQFAVYYNSHFNDTLCIRIMVASLLILDTAHSLVAIYHAWDLTVSNYMNPDHLATVTWTIPFTACATAVAAFISQIFLGHRAMILTGSRFIFGLVTLLAVLGILFGFFAGVKSGIVKHVDDFEQLKPLVICWLTFQTSTDLLITGVLAISLTRSKTGFPNTDTVLNRLIRGAVQTGLFASLFALGDLFAFVSASNTYLYALFAYPLGRIYSNTLLDTLNCRASLQPILYSSRSDMDLGTDPSIRFSSARPKSSNTPIALSRIPMHDSHDQEHQRDMMKNLTMSSSSSSCQQPPRSEY